MRDQKKCKKGEIKYVGNDPEEARRAETEL